MSHEEFNTFADQILSAIEKLRDKKTPISDAPLKDIENLVRDQGTSSIKTSFLIEKLIDAGYNIEDIREFFFAAGIIRDTDEWVRLHEDVNRAVVMAVIKKKMGG